MRRKLRVFLVPICLLQNPLRQERVSLQWCPRSPLGTEFLGVGVESKFCYKHVMFIEETSEDHWPKIFRFYRDIMAQGEIYAFPENQTLEEARPWWMQAPPGQTVVALSEEGVVLGSAKMGPNRPGRGRHIATASFLVDPAHQGQGVGRALCNYVDTWARARGYLGIQFNAVVEVNHRAVQLWKSLGYEIIGTVPESFDHPRSGLVGLHIMFKRLGAQETALPEQTS